MGEFDIQPGETVLESWTPAFALFLHKLLAVGLLTGLILSPFGYQAGFWSWIVGLPIAVLAYMVAFDDFAEWRRRRHDRWILTDRRLVYENPDDSLGHGSVYLNDIVSIRRVMTWALRLKQSSRQTVVMKFLPDPGAVRARIERARAAATGAGNG